MRIRHAGVVLSLLLVVFAGCKGEDQVKGEFSEEKAPEQQPASTEVPKLEPGAAVGGEGHSADDGDETREGEKKDEEPAKRKPAAGSLVCDDECQKFCKKTDSDAYRCVILYSQGCHEGQAPAEGADCEALERPGGIEAQAIPQVDWP